MAGILSPEAVWLVRILFWRGSADRFLAAVLRSLVHHARVGWQVDWGSGAELGGAESGLVWGCANDADVHVWLSWLESGGRCLNIHPFRWRGRSNSRAFRWVRVA